MCPVFYPYNADCQDRKQLVPFWRISYDAVDQEANKYQYYPLSFGRYDT